MAIPAGTVKAINILNTQLKVSQVQLEKLCDILLKPTMHHLGLNLHAKNCIDSTTQTK